MEVIGILFVLFIGAVMIIAGVTLLSICYGFGSTDKFEYIFGYGLILVGAFIDYKTYSDYITISIGG